MICSLVFKLEILVRCNWSCGVIPTRYSPDCTVESALHSLFANAIPIVGDTHAN